MLTVNHQFGILVFWQARLFRKIFRNGAWTAFGIWPRLNSSSLRASITHGALFDVIRWANSAACMAILLRADGLELTIG